MQENGAAVPRNPEQEDEQELKLKIILEMLKPYQGNQFLQGRI